MNKEEAAAHLGVQVRTLQRYTAQGKISARQERGKTGMITVYDQTELDRFKAELEGETGYVRPNVIPDTPQTQALQVANGDRSAALIELLTAIEQTRGNTAPADSVSDLAHKLVLTEKEAARYSGLPLAEIRKARKVLKSRIIGRGFKLKREMLEAWVKKL